MTSIVSQNAPAFFERTNTARSAIVAMLQTSSNSVRKRLVGEGDAGYEAMPFGDRVVHHEMRDARRDRVRQLLGFADHIPQDEDLVAADLRLRLERAHDAVAAIDARHD